MAPQYSQLCFVFASLSFPLNHELLEDRSAAQVLTCYLSQADPQGLLVNVFVTKVLAFAQCLPTDEAKTSFLSFLNYKPMLKSSHKTGLQNTFNNGWRNKFVSYFSCYFHCCRLHVGAGTILPLPCVPREPNRLVETCWPSGHTHSMAGPHCRQCLISVYSSLN